MYQENSAPPSWIEGEGEIAWQIHGESETHRHQNRLQKQQRRQKLGCSKLNWPRHELTPQQLLRWRRSVSRPDLAGALIDFVRVSILLYLLC
jgi:hypothetical protein